MKFKALFEEPVLPGLVLLTLIGSLGSSLTAITAEDSFESGGSPDYIAGSANLGGQGPPGTGFIGNWKFGFNSDPSVISTGLGMEPSSLGDSIRHYFCSD